MADEIDILKNCAGFEWDRHNVEKNRIKHGVSPSESEQIFFNVPLVVADDEKHSEAEKRFYALGKTDDRRLLFAVFTIRGSNIRIISVRDMNVKERKVYQTHEEENT